MIHGDFRRETRRDEDIDCTRRDEDIDCTRRDEDIDCTRRDEDIDCTRRDVIKEQSNLLNLVGCFDQFGHTVQPVEQVLSTENSECIVSTTHMCVCLRAVCVAVFVHACVHVVS